MTRDLWSELASTGAARVAKRVTPPGALGIIVTLSAGNRRPGLILETGSNVVRPTFPDLAAIRLDYIQGTDEWEEGCLVELLDADLRSNFAAMADQVVDALAGLSEGQTRLHAIHRIIQKWLRIFQRNAPPLSSEQQRGLAWELDVLNQIMATIGPAEGLASWTGPKAGPKDFERHGNALECKAHSGEERMVKIHGVKQLDYRPLAHLWLATARVATDDGGTSLPERVNQIRDRLDSDGQRDQFEQLLAGAGYHEGHANLYPTPYLVQEPNWFSVGEGFPAIIDAPAGITSVRYSLDLNEARGKRCDSWQALAVFCQ